MRTEHVEFRSDGVLLRALFRLPDAPAREPLPAIVQGPGWLGLAEQNSYVPWHEGLTAAGYAVLIFDYRGFGRSEGERGWARPDWQLDDWLNATTYLEARPEVNPRRIGALGIGGTGGGNAILAAALDPRIRAVAAQSVVADGADWLHRMRREYEWVDYLRRIEADRRQWVLEGTGEKVDPRQDLMVETPERRSVGHKRDVDHLVPNEFYLRSADYLMRYRPVEHVHKIAPRALLISAVEDDVVTPEDHAVALYERAGAPKKLIRQTETTHYRAYTDNFAPLMAEIVDWYDRYLAYTSIESRETPRAAEQVAWLQRPPKEA
jgi:hypothetical protein